jgi:UPF0042 nucleotide-binding protein
MNSSGSASEAGSADKNGRMEILLITGMSGAGKASTVRILEDLGYLVVDNIAPALIPAVVDHAAEVVTPRLAVVCDARTGDEFPAFIDVLKEIRNRYVQVVLLFLDASDAVLIQRFKESRRPHPLASPDGGILPSIDAERKLLARARDMADRTLDTSSFTLPDLRATLQTAFAAGLASQQRMTITVTSFGFKNGMPLDADLVFDVRFLTNPYWKPELRDLDGTVKLVRDYVFSDPDAAPLLEKLYDLIDFSLPRYQQEGKAYLTIGIGCTGGRHRSVTIAEALAGMLRDKGYRVFVQHRDVALQIPQEPSR